MSSPSSGFARDSAVKEIKARLNIVDIARRYIPLQRKGGRWFAVCPFHQEKSPSFSINEEDGFFYCFGCHASGDIFDFYSRINGLDFKETLEQLAEEAGIALEKRSFSHEKGPREQDIRKIALKMHDLAKNHYKNNLQSPAGMACRAYIEKRQLSDMIVESFELGFSSTEWQDLSNVLRRAAFSQEQGIQAGLLLKSDKGSNAYDRFRGRFMFPIKNLSGQTIAFGGRVLEGTTEASGNPQAKYINSADSPLYKKGDNLYGLFQARQAIAGQKSVILTEGYMDVITLHQFGYLNSCGVLGTSLTAEQIKRLSGFCSDFELIFDGDAAGRKAALRSCEMILARGLRCRVVLLPEGEDIDSLLHGQEQSVFEALRKHSPSGLDFCMRTLRDGFAPKDCLIWVRDFLKSFERTELISRYVSELSRGLDLDESEIRRQLAASGKAGGTPKTTGKTIDDAAEAEEMDALFVNEAAFLPAKDKFGAPKLSLERAMINFLARYPHNAPRLREVGIEFVLDHPRARNFWDKVIASGPDFDPDIIKLSLDDKQREFWVRYRSVETPPGDAAHEAAELQGICDRIVGLCKEKQTKSCLQALRQTQKNVVDEELLKSILQAKRLDSV